MKYKARRQMKINGQVFRPGQVVPDADKLQKFRTLVSAGWLVKAVEVAPSPPASPPADINSGTVFRPSPSPNRTVLDKKLYEKYMAKQKAKQEATKPKQVSKPKPKPKPKLKTAKK